MYQNYITGQTALSLTLDFSLPKNHLASVISSFVDSIPADVLLDKKSKTDRPAYHPALMLKIFLFAYSRRVFSGRKIERMLEENLPMMIMAEGRKISYRTLNNFRSSEHANKLIKTCFIYFANLLADEGLIRDFKIYEADEFQLTPELERLAKTPSGRQRQMHYNPDWQSLKTKEKEVLQSKECKEIYGMRKNDVEPIFGHMKNVFGMRRAHLRGKEKVETDVGMMFLMMNLNKYWTREVRY